MENINSFTIIDSSYGDSNKAEKIKGVLEGFSRVEHVLPNDLFIYTNYPKSGSNKTGVSLKSIGVGMASFNSDGECSIKIEPIYSRIVPVMNGKYLQVFRHTSFDSSVTGLFDLDGKELIPVSYEELFFKADGTIMGMEYSEDDKGIIQEYYLFDENFSPKKMDSKLIADIDATAKSIRKAPFKEDVNCGLKIKLYDTFDEGEYFTVEDSYGEPLLEVPVKRFPQGVSSELESIDILWRFGPFFLLGNHNFGYVELFHSSGESISFSKFKSYLGLDDFEKSFNNVFISNNRAFLFKSTEDGFERVKVDLSYVFKTLEDFGNGIYALGDQKFIAGKYGITDKFLKNLELQKRSKGTGVGLSLTLHNLEASGMLNKIDSETLDEFEISGKKFRKSLFKMK